MIDDNTTILITIIDNLKIPKQCLWGIVTHIDKDLGFWQETFAYTGRIYRITLYLQKFIGGEIQILKLLSHGDTIGLDEGPESSGPKRYSTYQLSDPDLLIKLQSKVDELCNIPKSKLRTF